ncbi:DUF167 domain-containing protein [Leptospira idonii]|uniref:UPF0235 protein EHS15_16720 n=1 Tax=Leptospira idonii TaxID=1193500 RepID=A0A4R9LX33_9LEPT|nr:DUF167 domain-containing protein [Leptospira idonii]TGN17667.1 DUF167 domain-containing protein [Leptospira idonii]
MVLSVQVRPGSKRPGIEKISEFEWIVRLNSPPVDGKANEELIRRIAEEFHIAKSKVSILSGLSSKKKKILVNLD